MEHIGKLLIIFGLIISAVGLVILFLKKIGIQPGKLPGDIVYRSGNTTIYFPIVTCILLSIVISIILWLLRK
jgi:hypothetical protein